MNGSSPRVRGTGLLIVRFTERIRFIPAYAGNRMAVGAFTGVSTVHPRVCGEQTGPNRRSGYDDGSSPRVRGTGRPAWWGWCICRFIPACAGNRNFLTRSPQRSSVHPRVCGEQDFFHSPYAKYYGSSPRVRGTVRVQQTDAELIRFIPACAGNSIPSSRGMVIVSVHPRVCGEQLHPDALQRHRLGSSPRVRGTATHVRRWVVRGRFIPACAGNSPEASSKRQ